MRHSVREQLWSHACEWKRHEETHRAHAGILYIHPNGVWHHLVIVCVVIGHNSEWRQHLFGNGEDKGNQNLVCQTVTATSHQLTSAHDLGRLVHRLAIIAMFVLHFWTKLKQTSFLTRYVMSIFPAVALWMFRLILKLCSFSSSALSAP